MVLLLFLPSPYYSTSHDIRLPYRSFFLRYCDFHIVQKKAHTQDRYQQQKIHQGLINTLADGFRVFDRRRGRRRKIHDGSVAGRS
jgi:hypothetical protein